MLFGYHPFGEDGASPVDWYFHRYLNNRAAFWKVHEDNVGALNPDTKRFLEKVLSIIPGDRANVNDLIEDPWCHSSNVYTGNELYEAIQAIKLGFNIGDVHISTPESDLSSGNIHNSNNSNNLTGLNTVNINNINSTTLSWVERGTSNVSFRSNSDA
jgi:serine/threonine protein kinase